MTQVSTDKQDQLESEMFSIRDQFSTQVHVYGNCDVAVTLESCEGVLLPERQALLRAFPFVRHHTRPLLGIRDAVGVHGSFTSFKVR